MGMLKLQSVVACLMMVGSLVLAGGARASTINTYSFTQTGYAGPPFDGTNLFGTFTGTVDSSGRIGLADLTSFSVTMNEYYFGGLLGDFTATSPTFFSFDTGGGPSTLAFAAPFPSASAPGVPNEICVGAAAAFGLCGGAGGFVGVWHLVNISGSDVYFTTSQFPVITLVSSETTAVTPIPATLPLFASGLGALAWLGKSSRRRLRAMALPRERAAA
jgi:hypothetical protein